MLSELARLVTAPAIETSAVRLPSEAESFPQQWAYETSEAKFKLVMCGRRGGKTKSAVRRTVRRAYTIPGHKTLYVTLIRRNCRKLFWRPLLAELDARGIKYDANEVDMICRLENGSVIEATGCDDIRAAGKIRGDFYDDVIVDEAQEPSDDILEPLVEEVLFPMLIDRGGQMSLQGTPPDTDVGYFVDRLTDPRWTQFGWSMYDNRFIPRAQIDEMIAAKGLTPDHPVYLREILGKAVVNPDALAYEYKRVRNDYEPHTVDFANGPWRHALGIDLGFQDSDAIVVLAWNRNDPDRRLYERYSWAANHQDVDDLADKVDEVRKQFRPVAIVGDHGGHGAVKVLETLKNRMNLEIERKPGDVMLSVGLVNDDLRTGRLLLQSEELKKDLQRVQRTVKPDGKVEINKRGYHSDLSEALRYAHYAARHYAAKPPKPPETRDERRIRQWREELRQEENPWS